MITGQKQVLVEYGFSDYETYGSGYCCAATGNLDAPNYMPQGSWREGRATIAHRDGKDRGPGEPHDGPNDDFYR